MSVDVRDIFMVIRAKDQASRVINSIATSATADFNRISREARLQGSRLGLDMANMRQKYDRAILQSRERLMASQLAGDKVEARAARERIGRLQLIRDAQALNIRQQQLSVRAAELEAQTLHAARQAAAEHNRELARAAGMWIAVGATMALVGGAGVVALHRMAMAAVEYERQAALTLTQVHNQQSSIKELQNISNNVAAAIGVPFDRLQTALYDIFSSTDVTVTESQGVLERFAKAAVAGQVDIQQTGRSTIAFMNAWGLSVKDLDKLLDIQFESVRLGSMTYAEFTANVGKAIPAVRASGQSIEFLGGTMAFLTRNGQNAAAAAVAIARGSELFLRKPVQGALRSMGIEALTASGRLRPINDIMTELAPHFANLDDIQKKRLFEKIFGGQSTIQARRFFELAIRDTRGLNRFIKDVTESSGAFGAAYNIMAATLAVRTERLKNQWKLFTLSMGDEATPALGRLVDVATGLLKRLNDLEPWQRKAIANTLIWGSVAIGTVGAVIALAGAVKLLRAGLAMVAFEAGGTASAISKLAAIPWVSIPATILAIGAATYYLAKNTDASAAATERYSLGLGRAASAARLTAIHQEKLNQEAIKNYAAFSTSQKSAELLASKGITPLADKVQGYTSVLDRNIATMVDWNNLTEDQQKLIDNVRKRIDAAIPIFEGYHAQQDKIREATSALAEAQHDLAVTLSRDTGEADRSSASLERVHDASVRVEKAKISLKNTTGSTRLATIRLREAQHDLQRAQDASKGSDETTVTRREQIRDATNRVKKAEEALREARGLNAAQINKNLREEVAAYKNWADNTQALIKRGVDPTFVQMLSQKGPEYVAAYVKGTDKQAREGVRLWQQREKQKERITRTESAIALGDIGEMVQGMNHKLNAIKDEIVNVNAKFGYKTPPGKSLHDIVGGAARGGYVTEQGIVRRSLGGPVWGAGTATSDSIAAYLSNGEYVVNAKSTARHRQLLEAINTNSYASGGVVTRFGHEAITSRNLGIDKFYKGINTTLDNIGKAFQQDVNAEYKRLLQMQAAARVAGISGIAAPSSRNRSTVLAVFASMFGWGSSAQVRATDQLLMHESGYRNTAQNPISTAYGMFQFLNSTWAGTGIAKTSDPRLQAIAGGRYIGSRYGSPIGAWNFWQGHHWYDDGGMLPPGVTMAVNRTGQSEIVMPLGKLSAVFRENLRSWVVPWLRRIAVGIERSGSVEASSRGGNVSTISTVLKRKPTLLTAQQLVKLSDAARWAYVARHGLPKAPAGFIWAEDFTYVPLSFYAKTSYHQGGRLPEDIMGVGRSGRTYGFQGGETVTPRGDSGITVNIYGPVYGADADQLAAGVEDALARRARGNGHRNVGTYLNGLRA